ncbi:hypothetical protein [Halostella salina]|uniref:hypothetical protein n=1 Tax=Halostella salina TaxID=1547897 RepID=UPI000EF7BAC0|nr:hypothetical protein [Halostella salina]
MGTNLYSALGESSEYVQATQNVPGQLTPVMVISPEDGVGLRLLNNVAMGEKTGLPIYGKFVDTDGNPLPINTTVAIGYKSPTDKNINVVSEEFQTIQSYLKKSITQQQDTDNIDSVKHVLGSSSLEVRDIDEAYLLVKSTKQVDPAACEFYLEQSAVEEVDIE